MSDGHGTSYSSINRVPRGLLGILDLVSQGEAPHFLPNTVQSTVNITPFYEINQRECLSISGGGAWGVEGAWYGTQGLAGGTPASGELWHVTHLGVRSTATLAAGTTVTYAMAIRIGPNGNIIVGPPVTQTVGQFVGFGMACDLWLGPDDIFGIWLLDYVAGTAPSPVYIAQIHRYRG